MYDAIILGGGPAGLQAALTLGRMHRTTLLLDSGEYRNATVAHSHNLLGHDGRSPAGLRAIARAELARYASVEVRDTAATAVVPYDGGFVVETADRRIETRALVLATGVRDLLPDVPGVAEAWGREIAHCPFCHGHEFAGRTVAVVGEPPHRDAVAAMLTPIVADTVILAPADLAAVERTDAGLRLHRTDGEAQAVAGMFVGTVLAQRSTLPDALGLARHPDGAVAIDAFGATSLPGVWAAGDMAHGDAPAVSSLAASVAAGQLAAAMIVRASAVAG